MLCYVISDRMTAGHLYILSVANVQVCQQSDVSIMRAAVEEFWRILTQKKHRQDDDAESDTKTKTDEVLRIFLK